MHNRQIAKPLSLLVILCATPLVLAVSGCGGGGGVPSTPTLNAALIGVYNGIYNVTSGGDAGGQGTFDITVRSNGTIEAISSNKNKYTGTLNKSTGNFVLRFSVKDYFDPISGRKGYNRTVTGQLIANNDGSASAIGNFQDSDDNGSVLVRGVITAERR